MIGVLLEYTLAAYKAHRPQSNAPSQPLQFRFTGLRRLTVWLYFRKLKLMKLTSSPLARRIAASVCVATLAAGFRLSAADPAPAAPRSGSAPVRNTLTADEKAAGWQLLFNGTNFAGWHNFQSPGVSAGWAVTNNLLACIDPNHAGDLVTSNQFAAFELQLDYKIAPAGNSGIMYHVTEQGRTTWESGPEFQLEDNEVALDPVRCGWLYGLYQPPVDTTTGKPLDATKPAGQWNHIRLLVTPEKCEHEINGVKYFSYVIGSDDFNARVKASKFGAMPLFAKSPTGLIALQGDHGSIVFRNIKILVKK